MSCCALPSASPGSARHLFDNAVKLGKFVGPQPAQTLFVNCQYRVVLSGWRRLHAVRGFVRDGPGERFSDCPFSEFMKALRDSVSAICFPLFGPSPTDHVARASTAYGADRGLAPLCTGQAFARRPQVTSVEMAGSPRIVGAVLRQLGKVVRNPAPNTHTAFVARSL
jgi:hypothetical protein